MFPSPESLNSARIERMTPSMGCLRTRTPLVGSYARFKHYLTTREVETCPEFWPPTPVSGPLCAAARRESLSRRGHLDLPCPLPRLPPCTHAPCASGGLSGCAGLRARSWIKLAQKERGDRDSARGTARHGAPRATGGNFARILLLYPGNNLAWRCAALCCTCILDRETKSPSSLLFNGVGNRPRSKNNK